MSKKQRKVEWSLDLEHLRARAGQIVSDAMGGAAETKTASLREALDNAASAQITIAFPVGHASIKALALHSPNLFEAELSYIDEYDFAVSGGRERVIALRQKSSVAGNVGALAAKAQGLRWDIALARNLPIRLSIAAGVGAANIDLSGLQIDALKLATGVGKALLTLPAQDRPLAAAISGGVGMTEVGIPAGAYGAIHIKGGLGEVRLTVAPDAAMRVEAKTGLGAIDLPGGFVRVSGEKTGKAIRTWQTANYADADRSILLRYMGGVGRFGVETAV